MKIIKKKTNFKYLLLIFVFCFALYYFQNSIKNETYLISSSINQFFFPVIKNLEDFFAAFFQFEKLKEENQHLSRQVKELLVEKQRWREIGKENEVLKKALNIGLEKDFEMRLAQVVGKDVSGDIFIINKGEKDGLLAGEVVITPEKVLVGKILKTYDNFSKVRLFTDKDFSLNAQIGEKEVEGVLKGEGNLKAKIHFVPKEKEVFVGDEIFTSNLGNNFPSGLLIGEVEKIEKVDTEFYQQLVVKPALDIKNLKFVFVILKF